jgi:hypothetical protein
MHTLQITFSRRCLIPVLCAPLFTIAPIASACGPDFPMQLLDGRQGSLLQLPESDFINALAPFSLPLATLPNQTTVITGEYDWQGQQLVPASVIAEQKLLSATVANHIQNVRATANFADAYRLAEGLPPELRWYSAGAVAFAKQDWPNAEAAFRQVLALPAAEQAQRRSWAMYSLARVLMAQGNNTEADKLFKDLYLEVANGLADPLNLAVSGLGEQGRLTLNAGNWQEAIALYGTQANYEHSGYESLLQVARQLLALDDAALSKALAQPFVVKLLTRYLLTQYSSLKYDDSAPLPRITKLLLTNSAFQLENATELAALSYQQGEYELASKLLQLAKPSAYGYWLSAKLAVRAGNEQAAAAAYANASKAFAVAGDAITLSNDEQCRVQAEHGVLQLQRGDYLQAMTLLYQSRNYWLDAAYVAERVLTIEELQQFVSEHAPSAKATAENADSQPMENQLRAVLARRLMRAGKVQQALSFFSDEQSYNAAKQYQQALKTAGSSWSDIDKAEALFQMATITREHGMQLFGYELAPDYAVFDGYYELWNTPNTAVLNAAEIKRVNRASDGAAKRFHYRYTAAALADKAADLVPENSQAFAATLCHASRWLLARDSEAAAPYYQRYLRDGAFVDWGNEFGQHCPEPDFAKAQQRLNDNRRKQLHQFAREHKVPLLLGVFVALFGAGLLLTRRLRRRQH